jgi:hypothetical protein
VVHVSPKKLDEHWKKDPGLHVPPGGSKGSSETKYQKVHEAMTGESPPTEMPVMTVRDGIPRFVDGRHRMAVARDLGVESVPVSVPKKVVPRKR